MSAGATWAERLEAAIRARLARDAAERADLARRFEALLVDNGSLTGASRAVGRSRHYLRARRAEALGLPPGGGATPAQAEASAYRTARRAAAAAMLPDLLAAFGTLRASAAALGLPEAWLSTVAQAAGIKVRKGGNRRAVVPKPVAAPRQVAPRSIVQAAPLARPGAAALVVVEDCDDPRIGRARAMIASGEAAPEAIMAASRLPLREVYRLQAEAREARRRA